MIGAGAAGIGAARRLKALGVDVLVLEAKDRIGGRAHTLHGPSNATLDMGCGWLHSAEQNPWTRLVEPLGLTLDRSPPPWGKPALGFPAAERADYRRAFASLEERLDQAADDRPDHAAADLFDPADARWAPLLNAFSGYYNGAPFDQISVRDYAAYQPTDENWRVKEGYGSLVAAAAAGLDIRLASPVQSVGLSRDGVTIWTQAGDIAARAVVVAVSTDVLAGGAIAFDPPLTDKLEAAAALPLGHVEKAFLTLPQAEDFKADTPAYGRTDTARTGSYTLKALGAPVIEAFFGGDLAADLGRAPSGAKAAFALEELGALLGSDFRKAARPIEESGWSADPFIRGAYSYARVGQADARARLWGSVADRIWFAGEACSAHAFSTAHGAYETGVVAADEIAALLRPS